MEDVIDLGYVKKQRQIRALDLAASHASLSECLKMLGLNDLSENDAIKAQIKKAINKLERAK